MNAWALAEMASGLQDVLACYNHAANNLPALPIQTQDPYTGEDDISRSDNDGRR